MFQPQTMTDTTTQGMANRARNPNEFGKNSTEVRLRTTKNGLQYRYIFYHEQDKRRTQDILKHAELWR